MSSHWLRQFKKLFSPILLQNALKSLTQPSLIRYMSRRDAGFRQALYHTWCPRSGCEVGWGAQLKYPHSSPPQSQNLQANYRDTTINILFSCSSSQTALYKTLTLVLRAGWEHKIAKGFRLHNSLPELWGGCTKPHRRSEERLKWCGGCALAKWVGLYPSCLALSGRVLGWGHPSCLSLQYLCCSSLCRGAKVSLLYLEYFSCPIRCPVWI